MVLGFPGMSHHCDRRPFFHDLSNMRDRLLAKDSNLSQFEIAQLANLCCDDSEEAKALIPR
jgi:DNA-directed RNA polymerase II subunit RPB4